MSMTSDGRELCATVIRLGEKVALHDKDIETMIKHQNELFKMSRNLEKTLVQIKYLAYGMAAMFVISQIGLTEALKKLL